MVDARDYHERTSYTLQELRETDFSLDHENKPSPSKTYLDLPRTDPVGDPESPAMPALEAIRPAGLEGRLTETAIDTDRSDGDQRRSALDCHSLCRYATRVTKTRERDGSTASPV